jgi:hypothetical protein
MIMLVLLFILGVQSQQQVTHVSVAGAPGGLYTVVVDGQTQTGMSFVNMTGQQLTAKTDEVFASKFQ